MNKKIIRCYLTFNLIILKAASVGNRMESRRYSNLMDLPGVNIDRSEKMSNSWLDSQRVSQDLNLQERRFFKDFRSRHFSFLLFL